MTPNVPDATKKIYWHRELPPLAADAVGEHVLEATSGRVPSTFMHHDDLWDRCHIELMESVRARLTQEIDRLDGDCAHVRREVIDTLHDDAHGEMWLRGRFTYVLLRLPKAA